MAETRTYAVVGESGAFADVLQEMRRRAGLTVPEIARQLGVRPGVLHQYLYRQRGTRGTSTVRWLVRYAAVCGCDVNLSFADATVGRITDGGTATDAGGSGSVRADGVGGSARGRGSAVLLG